MFASNYFKSPLIAYFVHEVRFAAKILEHDKFDYAKVRHEYLRKLPKLYFIFHEFFMANATFINFSFTSYQKTLIRYAYFIFNLFSS